MRPRAVATRSVQWTPGEVASSGARLSPAEWRLLAALADGRTQAEAAATLGLSIQTVKNHCSGAYRKLDVGGLVGAYARLGWLKVGEA